MERPTSILLAIILTADSVLDRASEFERQLEGRATRKSQACRLCQRIMCHNRRDAMPLRGEFQVRDGNQRLFHANNHSWKTAHCESGRCLYRQVSLQTGT